MKRCEYGCTGIDDCKASLVMPCPMERDRGDDSGKFQVCGHLERSRCPYCMVCTLCDGCYCYED